MSIISPAASLLAEYIKRARADAGKPDADLTVEDILQFVFTLRLVGQASGAQGSVEAGYKIIRDIEARSGAAGAPGSVTSMLMPYERLHKLCVVRGGCCFAPLQICTCLSGIALTYMHLVLWGGLGFMN